MICHRFSFFFAFQLNPTFSPVSSQSSRHHRLNLHLQLLAIPIQDNGSPCYLTQQQAQPHKPQEKPEERGRLEGGGEKVSTYWICSRIYSTETNIKVLNNILTFKNNNNNLTFTRRELSWHIFIYYSARDTWVTRCDWLFSQIKEAVCAGLCGVSDHGPRRLQHHSHPGRDGSSHWRWQTEGQERRENDHHQVHISSPPSGL